MFDLFSVLIGLLVLVGLFLFGSFVLSLYRKTGPNEALIISGRRHVLVDAEGQRHVVGFRIVKGGGAYVWPVFERVDRLSLETMTIDVETPEVYTQLGVPIIVNGVAQIKVRGDDISIATAAEQFLSKPRDEINSVVQQTLEGHLRAILGMMTVEDIYRNRETFAQRVQDVAAGDLANMGFSIVSFTIKDIHDKQGYLEALGKPRIAQVRRDAEIAEAQARRDAQIARAQADQEGHIAELEAQTRIAEKKRDYDIDVARFNSAANQQKAEADLAYDLQKYKTEQLVRAEQVKVQGVEKEQAIVVEQREIQRRELELISNVQKPADAERYRIQALAEAEQFRLRAEAAGRAEAERLLGTGAADAEKARGLADAEIQRAKGLADADVVRARGEAEATAMDRKAEAWRHYTEAAIVQTFIDRLPEIARAIADPLSKTERIILISHDGKGSGASRVTQDVTEIMAQLPALAESLTGLKLEDLIKRIPTADGVEKPSSEVNPSSEVAPPSNNGEATPR